MANIEQVDQESCGLCLHFQGYILDGSITPNFDSDLGLCHFHEHLKGILISEDLTPRQALSVHGLSSILNKMLLKGTTCFRFGGPRIEVADISSKKLVNTKPYTIS